MKVATWNVNSIRARLDRLVAWLETRKPDVVCLQETKVVDDLFPLEPLAAAGYEAVIHGQKTYNGVAILSRHPMTDVVRGIGSDEFAAQARAITATVEGVRISSVYVPNGREVGTDAYDYKLGWLGQLKNHVAADSTPDDAVMVCGDYNVAPDDRDVYDPEGWQGAILCSDPERKALAALEEWGLIDAFRAHTDEGGVFSWWDYRRLGFPKNRGLRIDHLLVTQSVADRLADVVIDREERKGKGASDHAPVIATLG